MAMTKPTGPAPAAKRRRANPPTSYGLAEPVKAGKAAHQPVLGFDAHSMVTAMWTALGKSVEARFFSAADWQRARWELWYANQVFTRERNATPVVWSAIQSGLNELLISPADKRRAGIELQQADTDPDEDAAVLQLARYQDKLAE